MNLKKQIICNYFNSSKVNAGFRFSIDPNTNIIAKNPAIVYGGLCKSFVHAEKTESFLTGKVLNDVNVLIQAFKILSNELVIDDDPVLASIDYRRSLALSLFYKFILYINDKNVGARYKSAKDSIIDLRPISSGQQSFPTDPTLYPITKPMKKLNAYLQASGYYFGSTYVTHKKIFITHKHFLYD
jgi:xanthine dehydrogenase/oxidase